MSAGIGTEAELNLGGGHSHCGILIYKGDNWPERAMAAYFCTTRMVAELTTTLCIGKALGTQQNTVATCSFLKIHGSWA